MTWFIEQIYPEIKFSYNNNISIIRIKTKIEKLEL